MSIFKIVELMKKIIIIIIYITICFSCTNRTSHNANNLKSINDTCYFNMFLAQLSTSNSHNFIDDSCKLNMFIPRIVVDTVLEEGNVLYSNIKIYNSDKLVYSDYGMYLYTSNEFNFIQINDTISYIILQIFDPISAKNSLVLFLTNYLTKNQFLVYGDTILDVDNDGILEIVGQEYSEAACLNCDSCYYSPFTVYKFDNTFSYSDTLSKILTLQKYNVFLDKNIVNDTILECHEIDYNAF